jgi:hypothetical protein
VVPALLFNISKDQAKAQGQPPAASCRNASCPQAVRPNPTPRGPARPTWKSQPALRKHRAAIRNLDQDLFEEVQARMREPTFGEKLSERMWKMEGLFAEAKQIRGE